MGATKQAQLEAMDNPYESAWMILTQLEPAFVSYMKEDLSSTVTERLSTLANVNDPADLTKDDQEFLVQHHEEIEAAHHYQDVATKDD